MKNKGVVFTLMVGSIAMGARPIPGQTISFFRQTGPVSTHPRDVVGAVAADGSGAYVFADRQMRKYDPRGNELWVRETSTEPEVTVYAAVADATGVYLAGHTFTPPGPRSVSFVRKFNGAGNQLWSRQLDASILAAPAVAIDATGFYVLGVKNLSTTTDFTVFTYLVRKYSADGNELWTKEGSGGANALAADTTGVYVFGGAGSSGLMRKYDPRGNELWTKPISPAMSVASDGVGVYVTSGGYVTKPYAPGVAGGLSLRKYDSNGTELWKRKIVTSYQKKPVGLWQDAHGGAISADATGVYVVGATYLYGLPMQCRSGTRGNAFVRKYSPDGVELWTRQFGNSHEAYARSVAVDAAGVYVIGQQEEDPTPAAGMYAWYPTALRRSGFLMRFEKTPAAITSTKPRIIAGCVVNAASYIGGGVAPGEIVAIFGAAMGPSELAPLRLTQDRKLATVLVDTRILFNGVPAPLLYVSDKQSSAIVPYSVGGHASVSVQVEYRGVRSDVETVPVLDSRPGIFSMDGSGEGQGAILNEDGSLNSASNPAKRGSIVSIYLTAGGEAAAGVTDGEIVDSVIPKLTLPVSAAFNVGHEGWSEAQGEVLYAGAVSGSVAGLLQVNLRVPESALAGDAVAFGLCIGTHCVREFQITMALR